MVNNVIIESPQTDQNCFGTQKNKPHLTGQEALPRKTKL